MKILVCNSGPSSLKFRDEPSLSAELYPNSRSTISTLCDQ
jgi:hypothetical protein